MTGAFFERGLRGLEVPREGAADPRAGAGNLLPAAGSRSCMTEEAAPKSLSPAKKFFSRASDRVTGVIASLGSEGVAPRSSPTRYLADERRLSLEDPGSRAAVRTDASSDEVSSSLPDISSAELSSADSRERIPPARLASAVCGIEMTREVRVCVGCWTAARTLASSEELGRRRRSGPCVVKRSTPPRRSTPRGSTRVTNSGG